MFAKARPLDLACPPVNLAMAESFAYMTPFRPVAETIHRKANTI